jgi:uncharacterized SAM-binding protein YcdF (DUF218 family)
MLSLLKVIGGPGSIGFLAMCSAFGLVLARVSPRTRQIGRIWLLSVYTGYIALGLPFIANYLAARLSSYQPISDLASLKGTDAIIVLDGDNRLGRVRETHRLFEVTSPRWVIVSGSEWLMTGLIETGIPADRLITDFNASTTLDQMHRLPQLLNGREATRVVIIASRLQMPRVAALTRATGLSAVLAPSSIDDEPPTSGIRLIVPAYTALRVSRDAIYEHFALAYYRRQGWIP